MFTHTQIQQFVEEGYVVYDVIPLQEATVLASNAISTLTNVFLQGNTNLQLLVDHELRLKTLKNEHGLDPLWRNGFSRMPAYSKSTGMVNSYVSLWSLKLHLDHRITDRVALLYDLENMEPLLDNVEDFTNITLTPHDVAYTHGFDRYSVKVKGTVDMPKHIDRVPYVYSASNTSIIKEHTAVDITQRLDYTALVNSCLDRVQTLLCSLIGKDQKPRDTGGLEILPRFHLYWEVLGLLLREQGLCKDLGTGKETTPLQFDKRFDAVLPWINQQLETYTKIYNALERDEGCGDENEIRDELSAICQTLSEKYNGKLPYCPREFVPLKWQVADCTPGQCISWDSRLPHRNLRNKSDTPRIAHYFSLYKVRDGYYLSPLHNTVRNSIAHASFGNGFGRGSNRDNREEVEWLRTNLDVMKQYDEFIGALSERDERLFCIRPYPNLKVYQ